MRRELNKIAPTDKARVGFFARTVVVALVCLLALLPPVWALESGAEALTLETAFIAPDTLRSLGGGLLLPGSSTNLETGSFGLFLGPRRSESQASLSRVFFEGRSVTVKGSLFKVGSHFSPGQEALSGRSSEETELLKQALGTRGLNLNADWKLARGLTLTSGHDLRRNDNLLDEKRGLTSSDTSHSLSMGLGRSGSIKASLTQHRDSWDRGLGRPDEERSERKLEFQTGFGGEGASGLQLALTSVDLMKGREVGHEQTSEAHLNLTPSARLRLHADYVSKEAGGTSGLPGQTETMQTVGATLQLAPEAQLGARLKTLNSAEGKTTQESSLALTSKVGGGASGGKLALEQKLTQRAEGGFSAYHKYSFAGGLGRDNGRTNLQLDLQETRGDAPESQLARSNSLHLDRAFGPRIKLAVDRRETVTGTNAAPQSVVQTRLELAAEFGTHTSFTAGLMTGEGVSGASLGQRRLALSHEWRKLRLSLEQSSSAEGAEETSYVGYAIEAPTGELPDWAKTIATAHEFGDADQYLLRRDTIGARPNLGFTGYRLWAGRRTGGARESGAFGLVHRRLLTGRWQLQLAYEQRPLGTDGADKGLPLPLKRQLVEIGRPLLRGLNIRGSYGSKTGLESSDRVQGGALGLWGKLGPNEQVEGEVSHDSGRWEGAQVNRTSVSLLYAHRVSEEHHVEIKLGYAWGENVAEGRDRDCRLMLSYGKPV